MAKPTILHLGDDIRWNHDLYALLQTRFTIVRSHSMPRAEFKRALETHQFGDFAAMYRPFWNTGGEMGNWDEELIALLPPTCRIFTSAGAGFDWVDTRALASRNILYCNSAAACTESVADAALWLILHTFRNFGWSAASARSCDPARFWDANRNIAASTHNPNGHTLGIIGLGRIGVRVAQKARAACHMRVLYNDVRRMDPAVEVPLEATYYAELDAMLAEADCVLLATPFAGEKVMCALRFAAMKPGARFVNIARGKLVDEGALVGALRSGQIVAAGLDVHFDEPNINPELAGMDNVLLLSHTAGASLESHIGFEKLGIENILAFFETGKALTPVNLEFMGAKL
ncbi:D-isomer specific 2-hydroxyacid dehydrogenase [Trichodelitschia bisporula]|uniref:D-isomer specific 2-hydroxyacid dehydrogenase n=1 Tax=Trichodelitschia bisporula TaxID=703511 RepID=A0A6G1I8Y8_9PEZI|nr:D-isomer specific 2-hydroxyacid dehydrogenase [Trichodelitschia bisporula]